MRLFSFNRKRLFSKEENEEIVAAIREAEQLTSGEIRVYIESHCRFLDPVNRAVELFYGLNMDKTKLRNGVILYIAIKDHQLAIYGDEGIHQKVGMAFWKNKISQILIAFNASHYAKGISRTVKEIGIALAEYFPYSADGDKNELPDEIVFGR